MGFSLLTDFYELTMMQGYFFSCPDQEGVFEMFFRRQPFDGGYTIFAGLGPLLEALLDLRFTGDDISYLESLKIFRKEFIDYLGNFLFRGDIYSVAEGTAVFPNEPLLRVHGNLMEAQLIESMVLNFINFQSLIATKSARICSVAAGRPVLEFGLRRAQGTSGALWAARAAFIGGASATSNTLAGKIYGIPVSGTMAHSWVMSYDTELEAFRTYADLYPDRCVLLVDTFDTLKSGIPNAITVFRKLMERNHSLMAVRIDSGDLEYLSKKARNILDENGLRDVKIFVSSDLDEWIMRQLIESGSPIDSWGVGTRLVTGWNDPALTGVYKIVASNDGSGYEPRIKISNQAEKITNPGVKNTMRFYNEKGQALADLIYLEDEAEDLARMIAQKEPIRFNHPATDYAKFTLKEYSTAAPQLAPVMLKGKIAGDAPSLQIIKERRQREVDSLDDTFKRLLNPHVYKISLSSRLKDLKTEMIRSIKAKYD
ncbi:MAG: nicotinate phosphoribosyltransferase [Spirochaetes bacterium RBG_13_51_14]|nr:MAG: nicotinate phosphoribosyltransferase [Spirochaetes bacterium RBG_13_51_14]